MKLFCTFLVKELNVKFVSDLAKAEQNPPDGFMVPKAWTILANYYKNK